MTLAESLVGAKIVVAKPEATYAWFGGHGVHGYDSEGRETEFFNVGSFKNNHATPSEVRHGIERWHKEQVLAVA